MLQNMNIGRAQFLLRRLLYNISNYLWKWMNIHREVWSDITHEEKAWIDALMDREMDYELFIDEDIENRDELIEYIRENSHTVVVW